MIKAGMAANAKLGGWFYGPEGMKRMEYFKFSKSEMSHYTITSQL